MLNLNRLLYLSQLYHVPLEDILFIALNVSGIKFECDYNRMRMAFRLADDNLFAYARERKEMDYYFALPIQQKSPFKIVGDQVFFDGIVIGKAIGATEDICDSNYPRRNGTSLNINPNSRTSCRGCGFCYTAYQVSHDKRKMENEKEIRDFFDNWMKERNLQNLSHMAQISVVTGCYNHDDNLCGFLMLLGKVLNEYKFKGRIFYLGSQIKSEEMLIKLKDIQPFGFCLSLETFERRNLLRETKRSLNLNMARELMDFARKIGHEVNFSYVLGMESLATVKKYFSEFKEHINKFPTINTLQIHKYHSEDLLDPEARDLEYFLKARKIIEQIFAGTDLRPLVWEDYRSLWFLKFGNEPLYGIRTP